MDEPKANRRRLTRAGIVALVVVLATGAVASSVSSAVSLAHVVSRALHDVEWAGSAEWPGVDDPPATTITWSACTERKLKQLHAQCGYLTVPLDWSTPEGSTLRLAVSRIRHTASEPQGVMIVNPGGPGGSGVDTVDTAHYLPASVAGLYDWVGFDPRGVGDSIPALRCDADYFDQPRPGYSPTPEHIAAWTARAKAYARACAANGAILQHMTTVDSARDLEALRIALGRERINYYGYSYGTYLGQMYATLYPQRVRRMILDSTEDPRLAADEYGFLQDRAFEKGIRRYFAWVATWDDVYHLGSTAQAVRTRFDAEQTALDAHPFGAVGAAEWNDLFLDAAYSQSDWPDLTDVFVEQVRHPDKADLQDAYDDYGAAGDNGYAAYLAVQCTDGTIDRSIPSVLRATRAQAVAAPYATWGNTVSGLPCAFWPAPPGPRIDIDGSRVRSVLMIDETLDSATPYAGSLAVRDLFPGARLIAEPGGTSHAQTPNADAPCVLNRIVRYLSTGALPPRRDGRHADATCAPAPEPVPNE